jgi:phenylalanyl-tRNA synthetase alpha chain
MVNFFITIGEKIMYSKKEINALLAKKDYTMDSQHAIGILVNEIAHLLKEHYHIQPDIQRGNRIVSIHENYYALGYSENEATLSSVYTRYIDESTLLRTQMSSTVVSLLDNYSKNNILQDTLWMCPGIVYRRDVRDRTHVAEPHQLDIWYLQQKSCSREDLLELVSLIISVIEKHTHKKIQWRYNETQHHYTDDGIEVEIYYQNRWLEVLECGLIGKNLLRKYGLMGYSGLALGLGLERLVMLIKDIDDIRILLSEDEKILIQLKDLKKYKKISNQPIAKRDLSLAVDVNMSIEHLTEKILNSVENEDIEEIVLISETVYADLPEIAQQRLGMKETQKNMLIRIILRNLSQSISTEKANAMYTQIYQLIHEGAIGYTIT